MGEISLTICLPPSPHSSNSKCVWDPLSSREQGPKNGIGIESTAVLTSDCANLPGECLIQVVEQTLSEELMKCFSSMAAAPPERGSYAPFAHCRHSSHARDELGAFVELVCMELLRRHSFY